MRGVILFLTLLLCGPASVAAKILNPAEPAHQTALAGLEALHHSDYERARSLLDDYVDANPTDPVGPLLRLKVSWWQILEGRDAAADLDSLLQQDFTLVRSVSERRLEHDSRDTRAQYALGEAWCTLGRLEGIRGHAWSTLRHHQRGSALLRRVIRADADLVEALASLGVYHYYASRAPGFIRFLARFFRVEADRRGGLDELRRAAAEPGMQQAEAAFFLLEILSNAEDEQLEALPVALRFHARYPHNIGFRLALATVQVGLGRPDAATRLLEAGARGPDPHTAIAARFFLARALVMTGRAAPAAAILDDFTAAELDGISWLPAWHAYYLGLAHEQLGDLKTARHHYEATRALPKVADSHGFAARALERRRGRLGTALRAGVEAMCWNQVDSAVTNELRARLAAPGRADAGTRARAAYVLGRLELQLGNTDAAASILAPVVSASPRDEASLVVQPRLRLLQALLWSGRFDEARELARTLRKQSDAWGSTRHLQLLIDSALGLGSDGVRFERDLVPRPSDQAVDFRLRDAGFTRVRLRRRDGRRPREHAMSLRDGFWQATLALPLGEHLYRFEVESAWEMPDPTRVEVRDVDGTVWSVRRVRVTES